MSVHLAINPEGLRFSARIRMTPESFEAFVRVLGVLVASRIALLVLGYVGARSVGATAVSTPSAIDLLSGGWGRWDASGYLAVARDGYWFDPILQQGTPVPFPLYPLLVRTLSVVLPGASVAAFLLSNVAFAIAMVLLYRLVARRGAGSDVAVRACLLLGLVPFSFVFSAADARSLVLLGAVVALVAEDRDRPWLATGAAVFASLAAPSGLVLWPALVVGRIVQWYRRGVSVNGVLSLMVGLFVVGGALLWWQGRLAALSFPPLSPLSLIFGGPIGSGHSSAGHLSAGPGATQILVLGLLLAALALLSLPRVARSLGIAPAVYVAALVGFSLVRLLAVGDPAEFGATLVLAFPCVVVAAEQLASRTLTATAFGGSAFLLAGVTSTLVLAAPPGPGDLAPAPSFAQATLRTFHAAFARQHPSGTIPRDLVLRVDDAFVILGDQPPNRRYQPGGTMSLAYYLYALRTPAHGYLLSLRLRDLKGNTVAQSDKTLWDTADASLDDPASRPELSPGRYLQDNLGLTLDSRLPTGLYSLQAEVFTMPSFARLPLLPASGAPIDHVAYADLVVARPDDLGTEQGMAIPHPLRAASDASVSLLGYDARRGSEGVDVALYWEAEGKPSQDYTVFVQALDRSGRVIAQSDSYPAGGLLPTSHLDPGEVIRDAHVLAFPTAGDPTVELIVGLYRLDTMRRAAFQLSREAATSDHVVLGTVDLAALP